MLSEYQHIAYEISYISYRYDTYSQGILYVGGRPGGLVVLPTNAASVGPGVRSHRGETSNLFAKKRKDQLLTPSVGRRSSTRVDGGSTG